EQRGSLFLPVAQAGAEPLGDIPPTSGLPGEEVLALGGAQGEERGLLTEGIQVDLAAGEPARQGEAALPPLGRVLAGGKVAVAVGVFVRDPVIVERKRGEDAGRVDQAPESGGLPFLGPR